MWTGHFSPYWGNAAVYSQLAGNSLSTSADSMLHHSTGLIHHDRESCRLHLCSQLSEPLLVTATSCPLLHHATPALVLLATYTTNAGPAADQPASASAPSHSASQRLSSHHRRTTDHGIHANTVWLTQDLTNTCYMLVMWDELLALSMLCTYW
jgi:hypothetical protein